MKATMNLPDDLYREVKVKAAREGTTVTSLVEEALRQLLAVTPNTAAMPEPLPDSGGLRPGIDVVRTSVLLDELEQ